MHEGEKWKWSSSVVSDSERPHGLQPTGLLHPRDFPGRSTGVGCHRLLWLQYTLTYKHMCMRAKSLQSCPNLCNPMDCRPPGFSVHGILQARLSEWVAVPSSRGSSWSRHQTCVSCDYCPAGGFFTAETYSQYQIMGTDDSLILVLISCSCHLTCPYDWASYYWASYYWASKWLFDRWKQ